MAQPPRRTVSLLTTAQAPALRQGAPQEERPDDRVVLRG
eukprot:SAG31_NODE_3371_length_4353_cov_3.023507_7_plen_39_part_00